MSHCIMRLSQGALCIVMGLTGCWNLIYGTCSASDSPWGLVRKWARRCVCACVCAYLIFCCGMCLDFVCVCAAGEGECPFVTTKQSNFNPAPLTMSLSLSPSLHPWLGDPSHQSFVYVSLFTSLSWLASALLISNTRVKF